MRELAENIFSRNGLWLAVVLFFVSTSAAHAQDTIILGTDTIRVGGLEWDLEKDMFSKRPVITNNPDVFGDSVQIFHGFYKSKSIEQIVFGYIDDDYFVAHGPGRYYYESGELLGKRTFVHGKLEGPATDYHKNGMVRVAAFFRNDSLEGNYKTFFDTGIQEAEYVYLNGKLEGSQKMFYNTGELKFSTDFRNGVEEGKDTLFYETGKVWRVTSYSGGKKNGEEVSWHRNGVVECVWEFENDKLMNIRFLRSTEDKPLEQGTLEDGNGTVFFYNENGLQSGTAWFKKGIEVRYKPVKK